MFIYHSSRMRIHSGLYIGTLYNIYYHNIINIIIGRQKKLPLIVRIGRRCATGKIT